LTVSLIVIKTLIFSQGEDKSNGKDANEDSFESSESENESEDEIEDKSKEELEWKIEDEIKPRNFERFVVPLRWLKCEIR
jgi:hypothetical protein